MKHSQTGLALVLSVLVHVLALFTLFWTNKKTVSSLWSGGNHLAELKPVFVTLSKPDQIIQIESPRIQNPSMKKIRLNTVSSNPREKKRAQQAIKPQTSSKARNPSGHGLSDTPNHGSGPGLDSQGPETASNVLARIRKKIIRRQFYPEQARQQKLSGSVRVEFKITQSGGLEYVRITRGSGHRTLDEAALATIKKATPLPYFPDGVALSLDYQLK